MFPYNNNNINHNDVHIETMGETRIKMMDETGRTNEANANWDLEYNDDAYGRGGLEGEVEILENGQRNKYRLKMDNRDLAQIFSTPHERGMLNRRLMDDFQMPVRRQPFSEPFGQMTIVDERSPIMDDSLMQIAKLIQQQHPQRSRRMHIDYSSGPKNRHMHISRRKKHSTNQSPRRRKTHRRKLRIRKSSSSKRNSLRSNVPLTEINA